VAMEGNKEIFKGILEPLIVDPVSEALKKQRLKAISTTHVLEGDELPDTDIIPSTDNISKFYPPFILFFTSVNNQL
jgi:hypothetical protein